MRGNFSDDVLGIWRYFLMLDDNLEDGITHEQRSNGTLLVVTQLDARAWCFQRVYVGRISAYAAGKCTIRDW